MGYLLEDLIMDDSPWAYYKCDDPDDVTVALVDSSGNARDTSNASTVPTMSQTDYAIAGASILLDWGDDDSIAWSADDSLSNSFAIEFWCRPTGTITLHSESTSGDTMVDDTNRMLFSGYDTDSGECGTQLSVGTNGVCSGEHWPGNAPCLAKATTTLSSTAMNQVVFEVRSKRHYIWVNGSLARSGQTSGRTTVRPPDRIGNRTGFNNDGFGGHIDEIVVWNGTSAITTAKVAARYEAGLLGVWGGSNSPMVMG